MYWKNIQFEIGEANRMRELISSIYGTIVYGKVTAIKPGSGNAASRLTIITLNQVNENGMVVKNSYLKILFWNSKNGKQNLSDRARKLKKGSLISCRVVFDAGIPSKAVGFEFKYSGLYTLTMPNEENAYILHGKVHKIIHGKNGYCGIYVTIKRYINGCPKNIWYLCSFFTGQNIAAIKGDTVFIRGYRVIDKTYKEFSYCDLASSDITVIHNM